MAKLARKGTHVGSSTATLPSTDLVTEDMLNGLVSNLRHAGWNVVFVSGLYKSYSAYGLCFPLRRRIEIEKDLSLHDRYANLVHETAHALLYAEVGSHTESFAEEITQLVGESIYHSVTPLPTKLGGRAAWTILNWSRKGTDNF